MFQTQQGKDKLLNVLSAFCLRNPDFIGYCQSMKKEDAFWILCSMVESRMGYYTKSMRQLLVDIAVLSDLIAMKFPQLFDHLKRHGIELTSICVPWFMCHFAEIPFPIDSAIIFWEHLFAFGDEMLFSMALKIFEIVEEELLQKSSESDILIFMLNKKIHERLPDMKDILRSITPGDLKEQVSSLRQYHRERLFEIEKDIDIEIDFVFV
jgi:hypothetical protein